VSSDNTAPETCQIDFYVLKQLSANPNEMVCNLAMTMWERNQQVFVVTETETAGRQLDELMWQHPEGRFLPHALANSQEAGKTLVNIGTLSALNPVDVVINLCPQVIPQPERFGRILEIVPYADEDRKTSRVKYRTYQELGFIPRMQEINK